MRSHGLPSFPDPDSSGEFDSGGIDPDSPQFQAAQEACKNLLGAADGGGQSTGNMNGNLTPEQQAQLLEFARCMRDQGISDFPDPSGGKSSPGDSGLDPHSPQFEAAQEACSENLTGLPVGGSATDEGGG